MGNHKCKEMFDGFPHTCPPNTQVNDNESKNLLKMTRTFCCDPIAQEKVDCVTGEWGPCNDGTQTKTIITNPKNGGAECPPLTRSCGVTQDVSPYDDRFDRLGCINFITDFARKHNMHLDEDLKHEIENYLDSDDGFQRVEHHFNCRGEDLNFLLKDLSIIGKMKKNSRMA